MPRNPELDSGGIRYKQFDPAVMLRLGHPEDSQGSIGYKHSDPESPQGDEDDQVLRVTFGNQALVRRGLLLPDANQAAILAASEPLVGAIVGMTVWHDSHEPLKLIGIVLVISAIVLQGLEPVKEKQA